MKRRDFLRLSGTAAAGQLAAGSALFAVSCDMSPYGPLLAPDENGIQLPEGFHSRVIARQGELVGESDYAWHFYPDGGAVIPQEDGWIYVSNSEVRYPFGSAGAIRFDRHGRIVAAHRICTLTNRNCAGGATPWGSWLTCEEVRGGYVYECDPTGVEPQQLRSEMGRFNHEAVAVDPVRRRLYLTEDEWRGRFYRFTPNVWEDLSGGLLEVAEVYDGNKVRWHAVPNPTPNEAGGETPTRDQVPQSSIFRGGEGIVFDEGHLFFTTKGDGRVWDYDAELEEIRVVYHSAEDPARQLTGVDNITVSRAGELIVAEDGGNMELVALSKNGVAQPLLRVVGHPGSELAGPAFDPWGLRLYFSSQRGGPARSGVTYEVTGPFRPWPRHRRVPPHGSS